MSYRKQMDNERKITHNFRQMKLASGEEIVGDVYQWNDETHDEIVIKNAMRLNLYEGPTGDKFFSFRPWMVYQENEEDLIVLLSQHVVSIAVPSEPLLIQYRYAVDNMQSAGKERLEGLHKDMSLEQLQEFTKNTLDKIRNTEKDLQDYLEEIDNTVEWMDSDYPDSDGRGKVIDLFTKKTIH